MSDLRSFRRFLEYLLAIMGLAALIAGCGASPLPLLRQTPGGNRAHISSSASISTFGQPAEPTPTAEAPLISTLEKSSEEQIYRVEEIIILMLILAVMVGILAHRLRVPYTIGLVLIGLILTLREGASLSISPALIMALLVPPLVFEAAFHLNLNDLRLNLLPILVLAVPGVILTTLVVGGILTLGTGLALPAALVFGAIVSATDPVSVVSLFRKLGVSKQLRILLEGESLFNDGTAIVVFQMVLAAAMAGARSFNPLTSLLDFFLVSGGGLAIGWILGILVSQLIHRIDDYLIETTLTSILAYGSYLAAEALGVSGVLAVVAAGLVNGNIGPRGMSPTTRIVVFNFWEYAAFLANTFVFLLIGLQIDLPLLFLSWRLIIWAILAVLVSRLISAYGLSRLQRDIPASWQHVLYWGGLRGAIALALALGLPDEFMGVTENLRVMTFGVVLFTLVVQGLTIKPLVKRLGVIQPRTLQQQEYERRHARAVASRAALEHLERRRRYGLLSDPTWQTLAPLLEERTQSLTSAVREAMVNEPRLEMEELEIARREYLRAQRSAISGMLKDGVISEETYAQLVVEIDAALTNPQRGWAELIANHRLGLQPQITHLVAAVIQEQDAENAINSLTKQGFSVTHLSSSGGFLGKRNVTLLIGLSAGQEAALVQSLRQSCHKRVEYLASLPTGTATAMAAPIPVEVGGATIFTFAVEHFENF